MDSNNLVLFFILIAFGIIFYKYFPLILNKYNSNLLIDNELSKPQAFHDLPTPIIGGLCIFISFIIIFINSLIFEQEIFIEYFSFCTLFFILGFSDDIKINIKSSIRLILMILFLIFLVRYNNFYLEKTGIAVLNSWIENSNVFSLYYLHLII